MKEKLIIVGQDLVASREWIQTLENNFEIQIVRDGMSAIQELERKSRNTVVLLSLVLPRIDGYQVLRTLKKSGVQDGVKVVALTGRETYQIHLNEFAELLHDTVRKPESLDDYESLKDTLLLAC